MLSHRQKIILNAIIEDYVRFAEPVGSRTLSKHHDIQLSAATIRNEMADLEELGYLDQPHTSAGRIPSQKGYRFYVDNLMHDGIIDLASLDSLRALFQQKIHEVERVVQQTSIILSHLTQQTAIILGPKMHQEKVKKIELIPLGSGRAVVILVTDTGHVQDRQVQFPEDLSLEKMVYIVRVLNDKLIGLPISRLRSHIHREMASELVDTLEWYEEALAVLEEMWSSNDESGRVYVGGAANILSQPEFRDVDKVRPLIELLEHEDQVGEVLPIGRAGEVEIRIGQENSSLPLQDCTVISATYRVSGNAFGRIGILGPTRMDYARIIKILDYTSRTLTKMLTDPNEDG